MPRLSQDNVSAHCVSAVEQIKVKVKQLQAVTTRAEAGAAPPGTSREGGRGRLCAPHEPAEAWGPPGETSPDRLAGFKHRNGGTTTFRGMDSLALLCQIRETDWKPTSPGKGVGWGRGRNSSPKAVPLFVSTTLNAQEVTDDTDMKYNKGCSEIIIQ